jgi:hypothetical protein
MKNTGFLLFPFTLGGLFRPALAIDLQPGNIIAPPPNITVATLSYVNSQNNDLFRNGVNTGADPRLESNAAYIRLAHTYTVGATYVYVTGGETAWNGVERNNTLVTQRYFVSGVAHTRVGRFTVQYGNDIATMNGFMESNRLVVRYAKAF